MAWKYDIDPTKSRASEIARICSFTSKDRIGRPVLIEQHLSTYYVAVRVSVKDAGVMAGYYTPDPEDGSVVFAAIVETHDDGDGWGCKLHEETHGPRDAFASAQPLALLSPTTDCDANEWRRECRQNV